MNARQLFHSGLNFRPGIRFVDVLRVGDKRCLTIEAGTGLADLLYY